MMWYQGYISKKSSKMVKDKNVYIICNTKSVI